MHTERSVVGSKPKTFATSTSSQPFLPPSVHRKRLTVTCLQPNIVTLNSTTTFTNPTTVSVTITPPDGFSVLLRGVSINATAAYSGTFVVKDGATTIASYTVNYTLGANDVQLPLGQDGLTGSLGNVITITGPAASAGNSVTVNVTAIGIPLQPMRVTISQDNPAVLDAGVTLWYGQGVVTLSEIELGSALTGPLQAISNSFFNVSIMEHTEMPCGCPDYGEVSPATINRGGPRPDKVGVG